MGYVLFIVVAFAMLGIQMIASRQERAEHQHDRR